MVKFVVVKSLVKVLSAERHGQHGSQININGNICLLLNFEKYPALVYSLIQCLIHRFITTIATCTSLFLDFKKSL